MAQAVSRQPLTAETQVQSTVGPCAICNGKGGTRTGFCSPPPPEYFGFPPSISFHWCSITQNNEKTNHLHHRVAQSALRLRCTRSICCGALHHKHTHTYNCYLSSACLYFRKKCCELLLTNNEFHFLHFN
jgi:hypothetical protein